MGGEIIEQLLTKTLDGAEIECENNDKARCNGTYIYIFISL